MFIGISVAYFSTTTHSPDEYVMRHFDASRIVCVCPSKLPGHVEFWFDDGSVDSPAVFQTDSYDVGGLIELVMQARLTPAEFLPSRYVGKGENVELGSTGSFHWSAKDRK